MNRSYSKIRHIQESNKRLENRFINEVGDPLTSGKPLPFDVSEKDFENFFNKLKSQINTAEKTVVRPEEKKEVENMKEIIDLHPNDHETAIEKLLEKGHIHTHIDAQKGQTPHWELEFSHLHLGNLNFSLSLQGAIASHDSHDSHDSTNIPIPHATVGAGLKIDFKKRSHH
jgi:hypothetical protein